MTTVSTHEHNHCRLPGKTRAAQLMSGMGLSFATASYKNWQPWMGLPIRTTVGHPRFLTYELAGTEKRLAPDRAWLNLPEPEFRELYLERLNALGPYPMLNINDIAYTLRKAARRGRARLVWLCFDDLTKPGVWCHRRILAEWLEQCGIPCPELTPRSTS